jgi:hypothetical protein
MGKSPFLMGKSTISMAIFNSYVCLLEVNMIESMESWFLTFQRLLHIAGYSKKDISWFLSLLVYDTPNTYPHISWWNPVKSPLNPTEFSWPLDHRFGWNQKIISIKFLPLSIISKITIKSIWIH